HGHGLVVQAGGRKPNKINHASTPRSPRKRNLDYPGSFSAASVSPVVHSSSSGGSILPFVSSWFTLSSSGLRTPAYDLLSVAKTRWSAALDDDWRRWPGWCACRTAQRPPSTSSATSPRC